jgi:methionyl-tRNA formyltransferase
MIGIILTKIEKDKLNLNKQDHEKATFFGKRTPEDGRIDWNWQKERIYNWVRAQAYPYPGAFSYINNQKITIDKIQYSDLGFNNEMPNGLILQTKPNILVKTPNGVIKLLNIREQENMKFSENARLT